MNASACGLLLGVMTFGLTMAGSVSFAAEGAEPDAAGQGLFPKALGVLSSERLMFPVDMGDWPLKIDRRRQLFVDDYLIASKEHLDREWHQPAKHAGNPIMVGRLPWEERAIIPIEIRRDAGTGLFRMWYTSRIRYREPGGVSVRFPALYAESTDGLTWTRPELGILAYEGSTKNNLVIHGGHMAGFLEDATSADPEKRYKALVLLEPDYVPKEGYFLYTSPDGIHWKGDLQRVVIPALHTYVIPQDGLGDTTLFRFDPLLGVYVCDAKFVLPGTFRCRGQCESPDLIHWSRPRFTLYPDEKDEPDSQVYGNISFVYEGMWLGLCRIMHTERTGWKQVEVELSMSRDGYHWSRPAERQPFLPLGDAKSWDPDYSDPVHSPPIVMGDELWFYYRGSRHKERKDAPSEFMYSDMEMGLAKLRRDGFASLNAGDAPGTVVTRPLTFSGGRLFVNAEVGEGGWIKAELRAASGQPVVSRDLATSIPLKTGATAAPMAWAEMQTVADSENGEVRLVFQLKNAKLYAFWIE